MTRRVAARGYVLPVGLLLAGSLLTNYLVGFALIGVGLAYVFRRRAVPVCPSCDDRVGAESDEGTRRGP